MVKKKKKERKKENVEVKDNFDIQVPGEESKLNHSASQWQHCQQLSLTSWL